MTQELELEIKDHTVFVEVLAYRYRAPDDMADNFIDFHGDSDLEYNVIEVTDLMGNLSTLRIANISASELERAIEKELGK